MACDEAREIARVTRGEKFISECGNFEVDSMVNWHLVKRNEFNYFYCITCKAAVLRWMLRCQSLLCYLF